MTPRMLIGFLLVVASAACQATAPKETGFLSDYSNLEKVSGSTLRYFNPDHSLAQYDRFLIEPVEILFHEEAQGRDLEEYQQEELAIYTWDTLVAKIDPPYSVTNEPGPGVARVRIAITEVSRARRVVRLLGVEPGGASMEAEIIDPQGRQLAAIIEAQTGKPVAMVGLGRLGVAKGIIDDWARRFRKRLDEAHGK